MQKKIKFAGLKVQKNLQALFFVNFLVFFQKSLDIRKKLFYNKDRLKDTSNQSKEMTGGKMYDLHNFMQKG